MYYIGIDIGGTNIGAGLVDKEGKIISTLARPTIKDRSAELILDDIKDLVKSLVSKNNLATEQINSIGIGIPGTIDKKSGVLNYANNLNLDNINIVKEMQKRLNLPIFVENDANCAAIGENIDGSINNNKSIVYITIGTGLGAGIIIDGKLLNGSFGSGGEAGHMIIAYDGRQCTCGSKGCWEAYASATALKAAGKEAASKYKNTKINTLVKGQIGRINAKTVFDASNLGDEIAIEIVNQYIKYLATGLGNLINIFDPDAIVLGGGVAAQGEKLLKPLKKLLTKNVYGGVLKADIKCAALGNNAGIVGAAMLYRYNEVK